MSTQTRVTSGVHTIADDTNPTMTAIICVENGRQCGAIALIKHGPLGTPNWSAIGPQGPLGFFGTADKARKAIDAEVARAVEAERDTNRAAYAGHLAKLDADACWTGRVSDTIFRVRASDLVEGDTLTSGQAVDFVEHKGRRVRFGSETFVSEVDAAIAVAVFRQEA